MADTEEGVDFMDNDVKKMTNVKLDKLLISIQKLFFHSDIKESNQYSYHVTMYLPSDFFKIQDIFNTYDVDKNHRWLFNEHLLLFISRITNLIKIIDSKKFEKIMNNRNIKTLREVRNLLVHSEESWKDNFIPVMNASYMHVYISDNEWKRSKGLKFIKDNYLLDDKNEIDSSKHIVKNNSHSIQSVGSASSVENVIISVQDAITTIIEILNNNKEPTI